MYWYKLLEENKDIVNREHFDLHYKKINGIYSVDSTYSDTQVQVSNTFEYEWRKQDTYESDNVKEDRKFWFMQKYFDNDANNIDKYIKRGAKFLDAGCGACFSSLLLFENKMNEINYLGVDISDAISIAKSRLEDYGVRGEFLRADLMDLPFKRPCFDVIFSEGVLHHTDSTEKAFKYLSSLLLDDGIILIYVYRKKAPVREYTDDLIRDYLNREGDNDFAWENLMPLTKLGKTLGDLNIEIEVEEDIPYLGINAGKYNLQRLFYYHICKLYYKENWNLEEMNRANFDGFKPLNCHRHTEDELVKWCADCGLVIERMHVEPSGITLIAKKIKESIVPV